MVRDKIPAIIEASGAVANTRILEDEEYLDALFDKQAEEARELRESRDLDELADNLEVLHSIGRALGYTPEEIEAAREQKAQERGEFRKRIFLISTD